VNIRRSRHSHERQSAHRRSSPAIDQAAEAITGRGNCWATTRQPPSTQNSMIANIACSFQRARRDSNP
jgi:hypothetical protein